MACASRAGARDRPSLYAPRETPIRTVARGPGPRDATMAPGMAREPRSPARVAGEGPALRKMRRALITL